MDLHRLGELRSIAYHGAIAARLDEPTIERVRRRLAEWEGSHVLHPALARGWRELLALSIAELAVRLVDDSDHMARLRSTSPFAGELEPRTRWQLWREVQERAE